MYDYDVRCAGDRVRIGVSATPHALRAKVWCSPLCAADYPVDPNEDRDDLIYNLHVVSGWDHGRIAERYGLTRQRVQQIVARRRLASSEIDTVDSD